MADDTRTSNLPQSPTIDELLGHVIVGGVTSLVRVSVARLRAQFEAVKGPDYETRAELFSDLTWDEDALGYVWGDTTTAYRGVYKMGLPSDATPWVRIGPLLDIDTSALDAAIALKAALASPNFTGIPTVPTAAPGTSSTQIASTAFVASAISALVASSPSALDTLNELAAALGNDANFATTITNALAAKAPLANPTFTGTPAGPTAAPGTSTTQLSTTAFVAAAITALIGGASSGLNTLGKIATALGNDTAFAATISAALAGKAPLANPNFTGTPTVPTAASGTNTTQAASTAFVATAISNLVASSPSALDTLNELAAALGNDANFSSTVLSALAGKAPIASPAFTGTPTGPTAAPGTSSTQLSTTAFVALAIAAIVAIANDADPFFAFEETSTGRFPIYVDADGVHIGGFIITAGGDGIEITNAAGRTPVAIDEDGVTIWGMVSAGELATELADVVKAEDASAPILGADLFFAGSSDEIVIDPRNIHTVRSDNPQAITTVTSVVDPPGREFIATSRGEPIVLPAAKLGSTVTITTRPFGGTDRIVKTMTVHTKALPGSGSPKIFMLGDSIFHRQVSTHVRSFMEDMGYDPYYIGTIGGSADGSASNEAGPMGETREGWATKDFVAPPSDADSTSVLAAGGEAAYLAASKETRRLTNPFLNAGVFSIPYYLSRFGFPNPDCVMINLSMNDEEELLDGAVADYIANMPTILTSFRAAMASTAPIILWGTTRPRSTIGDNRWPIRRELLRAGISLVRERAALGEAIAWCDVSAAMSQEAGWPLAAGTADPATGATSTLISDDIHMSDVNRIRAGRMLAATAHNMLAL